jgi:hypothetical protein
MRSASPGVNQAINGKLLEVCAFNRVLSTAERGRLNRYLAAKWGITLAPTASNADAQDWVNRVYANGGTVSSATAAAVNQFCNDIDAASLRAALYRTNLFCGSNLNAALVPLYLTPDKTVTNLFQFGTAMTNAAWLAGGNGLITRTATTEVGPLGYGYATKLTTPSSPFDIRQMYQQMPSNGQQVTLSAWMKTSSGTRQIQWLVGNSYSDTVTVTSTWQRFTKTFTLPSSGDSRTGFATVSELSDAAGFIYVWGMQCEYGATATSYNQPRYGNTTDTNNAFVGIGTDYAETGATGGLTGNGTSKYLNTGLNGSELAAGNRHAAAYDIVNATTDYSPDVISGSALATMHGIGPWTNASTYAYRTHNTVGGNTTATKNTGFWLGSDTSSTASVLYRNGSFAGTATGQPAGGSASTPYYILGNPAVEWSEARIGGYSIGLSMTAPQASAYYTAMQAFQTALTRNV